jgi:ribonuclease M5
MRRIRESILVEGRYDVNKLKQIVDTQIIETAGFGIFKNEEKRALLKKIAAKRGIIVLTDSDGAGFLIRNHLRGILPKEQVKHAYIPQIEGKEKRKDKPSNRIYSTCRCMRGRHFAVC